MAPKDFPNAKWYEPAELVGMIRPRDSVTILVPNGTGSKGVEWIEQTGKAIICSTNYVALNMGGKHGTSKVVTASNIVAIGENKRALRTPSTDM